MKGSPLPGTASVNKRGRRSSAAAGSAPCRRGRAAAPTARGELARPGTDGLRQGGLERRLHWRPGTGEHRRAIPQPPPSSLVRPDAPSGPCPYCSSGRALPQPRPASPAPGPARPLAAGPSAAANQEAVVRLSRLFLARTSGRAWGVVDAVDAHSVLGARAPCRERGRSAGTARARARPGGCGGAGWGPS